MCSAHISLYLRIARHDNLDTLADEVYACCAAVPLTVEDFFLMQLHAERAQYGWEAVGVVQTALEEGRCRLAGA